MLQWSKNVKVNARKLTVFFTKNKQENWKTRLSKTMAWSTKLFLDEWQIKSQFWVTFAACPLPLSLKNNNNSKTVSVERTL